MAKFPEKIKIGHLVYGVVFVDPEKDERLQIKSMETTRPSEVDLKLREIVIDITLAEEVKRDQLLLQTLSILNAVSNLRMSQEELIALAFHLYGLAKNNPDLFPRSV